MRAVALSLLVLVFAAFVARLATGWTGPLLAATASAPEAGAAAPPEVTAPLAVGQAPPAVEMRDTQGRAVVVGGPSKRWRLVTFLRESDVPEHASPWCRRQLCSVRDAGTDLEALDVEVVAIGADAPADLAKFQKAEGFRFPLLSDPRGEVARAYGVWNGEHARRASFVLDPAGVVRHADTRVQLSRHGPDLVERLRELRR